MKVFIHVTCRKPELLDAALLVTKTIRTGFPTYEIVPIINTADTSYECFNKLIDKSAYGPVLTTDLFHADWIEHLINTEDEPFIICDTDMVFHENMEPVFNSIPKDLALVGRHIPTYCEPTTGWMHLRRLHTCLMYISPVVFRKWWKSYTYTPFPPTIRLDKMSPIHQLKLPFTNGPIFYDTLALGYHALNHLARAFTPEQDAMFDHLNCGTYSDLCQPTPNFYQTHRQICANPSLAKGIKTQQDKYYEEHCHWH